MTSPSCARPACSGEPAAWLAYDYEARCAWLDDQVEDAEDRSHRWALCERHANALRVPRGWFCVDRRLLRGGVTLDSNGQEVSIPSKRPARSTASPRGAGPSRGTGWRVTAGGPDADETGSSTAAAGEVGAAPGTDAPAPRGAQGRRGGQAPKGAQGAKSGPAEGQRSSGGRADAADGGPGAVAAGSSAARSATSRQGPIPGAQGEQLSALL